MIRSLSFTMVSVSRSDWSVGWVNMNVDGVMKKLFQQRQTGDDG